MQGEQAVRIDVGGRHCGGGRAPWGTRGMLLLSALSSLSGCFVASVRSADATQAAEKSTPDVTASAEGCRPYPDSGCYWMDNSDGRYCWVPSPIEADFDACYALDSCDGGLGQSGGGCYKWAGCSACERSLWKARTHVETPSDIDASRGVKRP